MDSSQIITMHPEISHDSAVLSCEDSDPDTDDDDDEIRVPVHGKLFLQLHGKEFFHCTVSRFFTAW